MEFLDIFLHLDQVLPNLMAEYGVWIYAILFAVIFCETGLVVTPFLPGDSLLFIAGGLTATGAVNGIEPMNIWVLMPLLVAAAFLGDNTNYWIGRLFGAKLFANPDSKIFKRKYLDTTHAFFEKHGGKTLAMGRFVPIVRTFAPFVAGMSKMTYPKFTIISFLGGVLWVGSLTIAGHFLFQIPLIKNNIGTVAILIVVFSVSPALLKVLKARCAAKQKA